MSILNNSLLLKKAAASGDGGSTPAEDPVTRSLRLDGSSYLSFTPSTATSTRQKAVINFWFKLAEPESSSTRYTPLFTAGTVQGSSTEWFGISYDASTSKITIGAAFGSAGGATTAAVFRDYSSFYNLHLIVDTTESLDSNKFKLYINGVLQTLTGTFPTLNSNLHIGSDKPHRFGWQTSSHHGTTYSPQVYIANAYLLENSTLPFTDFIEDTGFGSYKPKSTSGLTFGTNGWHIDAQPAHDSDLMVSSIDRNDGDTDFADVAKGRDVNVRGTPHHSIKAGNPFTGDGRAIDFGSSTANHLKIWDGSTGDYNLGSDDFTMEAWYNTNDTKTYMTLFSHYQDANNWFCLYVYTNDYLYWYWETGGTYIQINSSSGGVQWQHHKWNHVAVTKSGTTHKLWLNGVQVATGTKGGSHTISASAPMHLGTLKNSSTSFETYYHGDGYVYDARISSSVRYTDTFDVPTEKFTDDSDTELLLQPDNSDSDWDDVDKSHNSHGVTENGTVTRAASTPYEAAAKSTAIRLDSESLITETQMDFAISSSDTFTAEGWFYMQSSPAQYDAFFSTRHGGADHGWQLNVDITAQYWSFYSYPGASAQDTTVALPSTGEWFHLAVVKNSSSTDGVSVYVNGAFKFTATDGSNRTTASSLTIGDYWGVGDSASSPIDAYVYDIRFTKNETRYSGTSTSDWGNFDEITAPLELNPVYIGGDQSGNKNHFQPTNISGHDTVLDTPTKNYAVLNALDAKGSAGSDTFREGNLDVEFSNIRSHAGTVAATGSGKYYAEVYYKSGGGSNRIGVGVVSLEDRVKDNTGYSVGTSSNNAGGAIAVFGYAGQVFNNLGSTPTNANYLAQNAPSYAAIAVGDIVQIALDLDAGTVKFGLNGDWYNNTSTSAFASAQTVSLDTTKIWTWLVGGQDSSSTERAILNAGQDPTFANNKTSGQDTSQSEFYYAPPNDSSGNPFKSLNTSNLAAPSVTPEENFDITLWQGNDTNGEDIDGLAFDPTDGVLTWIKNRDDSGGWHVLFDSVRGAGNQLATNETDSELASASNIGGKVSQWNTDGFRVAQGSGTTPLKSVNESSDNYVAWNWKAHQSPTPARTTYTVRLESNNGNGWDYDFYYDSSTGLPSCYMEIFENRSGGLQSLTGGKVAVRTYSDGGSTSMTDTSSQDYTLECVDINAITVKWYYDTQYDSDEFYYTADDGMGDAANGYLNEQKITIFSDSSSYASPDFTANSYSNDSGNVYTGYSPSSPWGNEDSLKTASTSYTGTDTATIVSGSGSSGPTEKYNDAAGFTMIKYAGDGYTDGDTQTLDHSLGVPLEFVMAKARTSNDGYDNGDWIVWHKDLGSSEYLFLNENYAKRTESSSNDLIATATSGTQHQVVVNNGTDGSSYNYHYLNSGPDAGTGEDYILYGWAGVESYSKFGKYTGNGSTSGGGPVVYLGFEPALLMIKRIDSSNNWVILDGKRNPSNTVNLTLQADSSLSEAGSSDTYLDFTSTGFKVRNTSTANWLNATSGSYIYAAFAESPFKHANAR